MSHNTYLDYISQLFATQEEFEAFSASMNQPLPRTFSTVQSRNIPKETLASLKQQGFQATVSDYNANNYKIDPTDNDFSPTIPLGKTIEHLLGYFYIQETAASLPATIADIPAQGNILDMCAAPGGKTTQLADRCKIIGSQALVRANDPDSKRLVSLGANLTRTGMENVVITNRDGTHIGNKAAETFDVVLLDAPCSGEGTGFKSDFGTKFWDLRKVEKIARVQQQLLISAVKACKVGGQIIYSTCTTNPIENEMNIAWIMEKYPGVLELQDITIDGLSNGISSNDLQNTRTSSIAKKTKRLWPHIQGTGGFFLCSFKKTNSLASTDSKSIGTGSSKFLLCNQEQIKNWLYETYEITVPEHIVFVGSKNQIYASYRHIIPFLSLYQRDRPGLPVIKGEKPSDWRVTHGAGLLFNFGKQFQIELNEEQIRAHVSQQDISIQTNASGYVQLLWKGKPAGVGKIVDGIIKNKFTGVL